MSLAAALVLFARLTFGERHGGVAAISALLVLGALVLISAWPPKSAVLQHLWIVVICIVMGAAEVWVVWSR